MSHLKQWENSSNCIQSSKIDFLAKKNKILLYKALIRLTLVYACSVWSMITCSNFNKLQTVQNKFLRIIGNYREFTLISLMHKKLNVEYIYDFIK